jgi:uncharacterized protein (DUF305 family)
MRAWKLFPAVVALALPLAACGSDAPANSSSSAGEPSASATLDTVSHPDDVMFLTMMIPHHGQALEMAELALEFGEDSRVLDLAQRIADAQGPEIEQMQQWLRDGGHPVPDSMTMPTGHAGHGGMEGMLTDIQLEELRKARGHDFDHLFLQGMVAHHEGAVEMSKPLLSSGRSGKAIDLAREIDRAQRAEVREMKALLEEISEHDR